MTIKIQSEYNILAVSASVPAYSGNFERMAVLRSREVKNGIEYAIHYVEIDSDGEKCYQLGVFSSSLYEASIHFKRRVDKISSEIDTYHSWLNDMLLDRGIPDQGRDVRLSKGIHSASKK